MARASSASTGWAACTKGRLNFLHTAHVLGRDWRRNPTALSPAAGPSTRQRCQDWVIQGETPLPCASDDRP